MISVCNYGKWRVVEANKGEIPFNRELEGYVALYDAKEFIHPDTGEVLWVGQENEIYFHSLSNAWNFIKRAWHVEIQYNRMAKEENDSTL